MDSKLIQGRVNRIVQTSGPTLFEVNKVMIAGFAEKGTRAYPEIKEGSYIKAEITGEKPKIVSYKLYVPELIVKEFSDSYYEPLRKDYEQLAKVINKAVVNNYAIIIHHDNDVDGHSAGYQMELALKKTFNNHFITKRVSRTPFLNLEDANRDLAIKEKVLVIVMDNGSSDDNYEGIKRLKDFNALVAVVDHHPISNKCKDLVDAHVNPRQVNLTHHLSTAMITFEFCHATTSYNNFLVPAVAGFADHSKSKAWMNYMEKANHKKSRIKQITEALDYEIRKARLENKTVLNAILNPGHKQHDKVIDTDIEQIQAYKDTFDKIIPEYVTKEENIFIVNLEKVSTRSYPTSGVIMDWVVDKYVKLSRKELAEGKTENCFILGILDHTISMRNVAGADFTELLKQIKTKFDGAHIGGGGHADRATVAFLRNKEEILKYIKKWANAHQ